MKNLNNHRIRAVWLPLFAFVLIVAGGCKSNNSSPTGPSGGGGTPPANQVWMQNTAYNPAALTVDAGTTVLWINKDGMAHTVTSGIPGNPDGAFTSGNIAPGDSFRFTFNSSRTTYHYYCQIHPVQMQATVTVR